MLMKLTRGDEKPVLIQSTEVQHISDVGHVRRIQFSSASYAVIDVKETLDEIREAERGHYANRAGNK